MITMNRRQEFFIISAAVFLGIALLAAALYPGLTPGIRSGDKDSELFESARRAMVEEQIAARGIRQPTLLEAMRAVPRHLFVPPPWRGLAYTDSALAIGQGQTISQPYIVALMTELAAVEPGDAVLEIGTGSGYQAAILSVMAAEVYTIEYLEPLGRAAEKRLADLGYANVKVHIGDGYKGWPEPKTFDAILVTAAIDHVPQPLLDQLKSGGRLVIPVGNQETGQSLLLIKKDAAGQAWKHDVTPVRFVPFLGERQDRP